MVVEVNVKKTKSKTDILLEDIESMMWDMRKRMLEEEMFRTELTKLQQMRLEYEKKMLETIQDIIRLRKRIAEEEEILGELGLGGLIGKEEGKGEEKSGGESGESGRGGEIKLEALLAKAIAEMPPEKKDEYLRFLTMYELIRRRPELALLLYTPLLVHPPHHYYTQTPPPPQPQQQQQPQGSSLVETVLAEALKKFVDKMFESSEKTPEWVDKLSKAMSYLIEKVEQLGSSPSLDKEIEKVKAILSAIREIGGEVYSKDPRVMLELEAFKKKWELELEKLKLEKEKADREFKLRLLELRQNMARRRAVSRMFRDLIRLAAESFAEEAETSTTTQQQQTTSSSGSSSVRSSGGSVGKETQSSEVVNVEGVEVGRGEEQQQQRQQNQ